MEVGNGEAEAGRGLETAAGRVHADGGGREGIGGREDESAPILAVMVGRVGGASEDVVPSRDGLSNAIERHESCT